MKTLILILTMFFATSQTETYKIRFEIVTGKTKKRTGAEITIYQNNKQLESFHTNGVFDLELPKGEYLFKLNRCKKSELTVKANANKKMIIFVNECTL